MPASKTTTPPPPSVPDLPLGRLWPNAGPDRRLTFDADMLVYALNHEAKAAESRAAAMRDLARQLAAVRGLSPLDAPF